MNKIPFYLILIILSFACADLPKEQNEVINQEIEEVEDSTENTMDTIPQESVDETLTYLALGDSYTIGESVKEYERWPVQLVERLRLHVQIENPQIIARTGWTTDELQKAIDGANIDPPYDLVSLLIGVNNQYRGYNIEQYQAEFEKLLKQALEFAGGDTSHVFVVSIPDYGVTPFAESRDSDKIAREIDEYNQIAKDFADAYKVRYFNITDISRRAETDPGLVAGDGLHPSGKMYAEWVDLIFPWVYERFTE